MTHVSLVNWTDETVRLVFFAPSVLNPMLPTVVWQVMDVSPIGLHLIELPQDFEVQVRYDPDPANHARFDTEMAAVAFTELPATFSIEAAASEGGRAAGAVIRQESADQVMHELRIVNRHSAVMILSILRGGRPIHQDIALLPGNMFVDVIHSSIHVAVVPYFVRPGDVLVREAISNTQTELLPNSALVVTGSMWRGYVLSVEQDHSPAHKSTGR